MELLDKLRYKAASTGTGILPVTIEELNAARIDAQQVVERLQQQVAQLLGLNDHLRKQRSAYISTIDELRKELTTLRGLVEKLPVAGLPVEHSRPDDFIVLKDGEGWLAYTYNYWAKFATEDEAKAYAALLTYHATLPREGATSHGGEHE